MMGTFQNDLTYKKKINNREPDKLCCCFFITRRQNSLDAAAFFSFFIIACAIKMEVRGKSRANPKPKIDDVWSRNDMQLARGKATTKNESTALNCRHTQRNSSRRRRNNCCYNITKMTSHSRRRRVRSHHRVMIN